MRLSTGMAALRVARWGGAAIRTSVRDAARSLESGALALEPNRQSEPSN